MYNSEKLKIIASPNPHIVVWVEETDIANITWDLVKVDDKKYTKTLRKIQIAYGNILGELRRQYPKSRIQTVQLVPQQATAGGTKGTQDQAIAGHDFFYGNLKTFFFLTTTKTNKAKSMQSSLGKCLCITECT